MGSPEVSVQTLFYTFREIIVQQWFYKIPIFFKLFPPWKKYFSDDEINDDLDHYRKQTGFTFSLQRS